MKQLTIVYEGYPLQYQITDRGIKYGSQGISDLLTQDEWIDKPLTGDFQWLTRSKVRSLLETYTDEQYVQDTVQWFKREVDPYAIQLAQRIEGHQLLIVNGNVVTHFQHYVGHYRLEDIVGPIDESLVSKCMDRLKQKSEATTWRIGVSSGDQRGNYCCAPLVIEYLSATKGIKLGLVKGKLVALC